jgi:RimJ/RimL family protein N-acetyltransferase
LNNSFRKEGQIVNGFKEPPHPKGIFIEGKLVSLNPLVASQHSEELFSSNAIDKEGINWTYLPYGPFKTLSEYSKWIESYEKNDDPVFFAIISKKLKKAIGIASYLRINPVNGSIEVGHINYSPLLQRTNEATEAMFLMMKWAFNNGYRRYEWKCNSLNLRSRIAAQRLGFSYEGVFRQMSISKGRNRDTAWFAIIDKEWEKVANCFHQFLSDSNFDKKGQPIIALSTLTKPFLYKLDNLDCT